MNYEQALTHAGLTPDVRMHQLYLQDVAAGMAQAREVMTMALEALENSVDLVSNEARNAEEMYGRYPSRLARIQGLVALEVAHEKAITALREALASEAIEQPAQQQEPVSCVLSQQEMAEAAKRYTSPPTLSLAQRTWVGLTDDEIEQGQKESWVSEQAWQSAVWWAEAKLKEKNSD